MYLLISGIFQLVIVLLILKSINKLRERIVYLEAKEKVLEDKIKSLNDRLKINNKEG